MRAGNIFRVQPNIIGRGDFESQAVVLSIIFPDKNFRAVGRNEFKRLRLFTQRGFFLGVFKIAARNQLGAYLVNVGKGSASRQGVRDAFQINNFFATKFNLRGSIRRL